MMNPISIEKSFQTLADEVREFRDIVLSRINTNERARSLYKGCDIMYSSLIEKPTFLFIGINPGDGYFKTTGEIIRSWDLNPGEGFEYLNALEDGYDYRLAQQTRELFELAGLYKYLEKAVKTNFFYFTTSNEYDLYELFKALGEEINGKFHAKAQKWTREIIEIFKPKIIICESIRVLDRISWLYNIKPIRLGSFGYFIMDDNTFVFGYSRIRSNIKDKILVADFMKAHFPDLINA